MKKRQMHINIFQQNRIQEHVKYCSKKEDAKSITDISKKKVKKMFESDKINMGSWNV